MTQTLLTKKKLGNLDSIHADNIINKIKSVAASRAVPVPTPPDWHSLIQRLTDLDKFKH
jgi:hypothetical protein